MRGFSLIELLISLIIISIITATLAPIITKRSRYQNATYSSTSIGINCAKFDSECLVCTKKECTLCATQFMVEQGYYVNPAQSCEVKQCPGACSSCNANGCTGCKAGYGFNPDTLSCEKCAVGTYSLGGTNGCLLCSTKSENCSTCDSSTGVCSGCTEGYILSDDACIQCPNNFLYIKEANICAAKFNAGDTNYGGLAIPSGVGTVAIQANSGGGGSYHNNRPLCWVGNGVNQTANPCNSNGGSYSGCKRSVCNWAAANKICAYHGLRLPKNSEIALFNKYSKNLGNNGMQLCDYNATSGYSQCRNTNRCQSSYLGYCDVLNIWSAQSSGSQYYNYDLHSGVLGGPYLDEANYAFSVRCVKSL